MNLPYTFRVTLRTVDGDHVAIVAFPAGRCPSSRLIFKRATRDLPALTGATAAVKQVEIYEQGEWEEWYTPQPSPQSIGEIVPDDIREALAAL